MKHSQVYQGGLARFVALKTMDELCPLCLKMGNNKRIKAVQINLDEAVWMCENEECPWPFGYETPAFLSRKVGWKHSNEWEIYKKVQKRVGPIPVSTELSLYTPPVTPSSDTTTKESVKSDFSGETNISERMDQMGNILGCTNDSYAPKSSPYDEHTSNENKNKTPALNACVKNEATGSCAVLKKAQIPQSIFDIDSTELPSDKIIIKDICSESKKPEPSLASMEILDVKKSEEPIDPVLNKFENVFGPKGEKLEDKTKETITGVTEEANLVKIKPQVTKIAKAQFDLNMIERRKIVTIRKSVETKEEGKIKADLTKKIKPENLPILIDKNSHEPDVLTKNRILDDTQNSKQHTTTITLDGSLPITLSYDLTDLEENCKGEVPTTSTPVRESSMAISDEKEGKTPMESPEESRTKRIRPPAKRRAALIGKQYEKFSFSALKKSPDGTKDCDDRSGSTIVSSNERVKLEFKIIKDENCPMGAPDDFVDNGISEASNQLVESLNLANFDPASSRTISDDPVVESLNLSVLDDLLLDGYQNATVNLNDDWLESFFTTLDT